MTHTPGPWWIDTIVEYKSQLRNGHYGIFTREREVARIHVADPASTNARDDARLIAAAPQLLEALEALSEAVRATREGKRDGGTFGRLSIADDAAQSAIRAARGEE